MRRVAPLMMAGCVALGGCYDAPVESPPTTTTEVTNYSVLASGRNKVDILFMIDDSDSMQPKQDELKKRFPQLISQLEQFATDGHKAWYHIGVVTSDLGAAGISCGNNLGGKLQPIGRGADLTKCHGLGGGFNFINYNQLDGSNNLPAGQDLATTFQCMASVGLGGCGYEHQLESVYRALHDTPAENHDFLRDDAILAVVFVTDEDDCSAPLISDLFTGAIALPPAGYGPKQSFRCTQFGIQCGDPLMSIPSGPNAWSHCDPTPGGGKLFDVSRYVTLFTKPLGAGGIKADPDHDVILVSIAGDIDKGVTELLANPDTIPHQPCAAFNGGNCTWVLGHSCHSDSDATWVGDPAVRISHVVAAAKQNQFTSVCAGSYQPALQSLADLIEAQLKDFCFDKPVANPDDPDCIVEDVTPSTTGGQDAVFEMLSCKKTTDVPPCWRPLPNPACKPINNPLTNMPEQIGIQIDRGGVVLPPGVHTNIECATIAHSSN